MEYKGKLYGKVGKTYFPLEENTEYVKRLNEKITQLEKILKENKVSYTVEPADICPHNKMTFNDVGVHKCSKCGKTWY